MTALAATTTTGECRAPRHSTRSHRRCACRSLPAEYKRKVTFRTDWWPALVATFCGQQRLSRFVALWARGNDPVSFHGADNIPANGQPFVLALNHISGVGHVTSLVAATLKAVGEGRPEVVDEVAVVAGAREPDSPGGLFRRLTRRAWGWAKERWSYNLIETLMAGEATSPKRMLAWRRKSAKQPTLLFPEGLPKPLFGLVRDGCGNWLYSLKQPVIPVAVWWQGNTWHVRFGQPICWSDKARLHDLQLGFAIAKLMPRELLDPAWVKLLERSEQLRQADAA